MENTEKANKKDILKIVDCIILVLLAAAVTFFFIGIVAEINVEKNYDDSTAQKITGTVIKTNFKRNIEKIKFSDGHVEEYDFCIHHIGDTMTMYTDKGAYAFCKENLPYEIGEIVYERYVYITIILTTFCLFVAAGSFLYNCALYKNNEEDDNEDDEEAVS